MLVWFSTIAVLGLNGILRHPAVVGAVLPTHAIRFFAEDPGRGLIVLGAVFLAVTGGEALYADLGHFGHTAIQLAWFTIPLPALMLNYFGQGALLLTQPQAAANPFYLLAPAKMLYALIPLATAAAVIASQDQLAWMSLAVPFGAEVERRENVPAVAVGDRERQAAIRMIVDDAIHPCPRLLRRSNGRGVCIDGIAGQLHGVVTRGKLRDQHYARRAGLTAPTLIFEPRPQSPDPAGDPSSDTECVSRRRRVRPARRTRRCIHSSRTETRCSPAAARKPCCCWD